MKKSSFRFGVLFFVIDWNQNFYLNFSNFSLKWHFSIENVFLLALSLVPLLGSNGKISKILSLSMSIGVVWSIFAKHFYLPIFSALLWFTFCQNKLAIPFKLTFTRVEAVLMAQMVAMALFHSLDTLLKEGHKNVSKF